MATYVLCKSAWLVRLFVDLVSLGCDSTFEMFVRLFCVHCFLSGSLGQPVFPERFGSLLADIEEKFAGLSKPEGDDAKKIASSLRYADAGRCSFGMLNMKFLNIIDTSALEHAALDESKTESISQVFF